MGVAGALALAAFVKANAVIFLGTPRTAAVDGAHECGPWMRAPMLALAGACGLIGLAPVLVWPAIARAVGAWNEPWAGTAPAAPLGTLSAVNGALAAILIGGAIVLERRVRAHGLRRGPTWSCGYAAPTARMQYTSGSFAGIVAGWFASLFRPERTGRRPHGPFPERASRIERLPDTVLAGVIEPAAALVMRGSRAARRLQHGRLQFYLVYLAGGLAAIAILMFWEARR
jgi:hydrogenase-4 component B